MVTFPDSELAKFADISTTPVVSRRQIRGVTVTRKLRESQVIAGSHCVLQNNILENQVLVGNFRVFAKRDGQMSRRFVGCLKNPPLPPISVEA